MATRHWAGVLLVAVVGTFAFPMQVDSQDALGICQDQLRGVRVYAERLTKEKQGSDLDAAQTIANLIKQVESLQAEVQRMKTKPEEKPASSGQPAAGSVQEKKE